MSGLVAALENDFLASVDIQGLLNTEPGLDEAGLRARILTMVEQVYLEKFAQVEASELRHLEKQLMMQQVDHHWKEHLAAMDYLRQDSPAGLCSEKSQAGVQT